MITIYKNKCIPKELQVVKVNDVFFNQYTVEMLDDRAEKVISEIDQSQMLSKYTFKSKLDGTVLNVDKLSTGCKTVLNIIYHPNIIFDIRECGENALDIIYGLSEGKVFCDYPLISFEMKNVCIYDKKEKTEVDSYEKLKEWWIDEN